MAWTAPPELKGYSRRNLPVLWRSSKKAWVTRSIFQEWFTHFFCPTVEKYCARHKLLIVDAAPCHPENLAKLSGTVRVESLLDSAADVLQPMGRGIAAAFKARYLRRTLEHILEVMDGEDPAVIREFWRKYSIADAVDNTAVAWEDLRQSAMDSAWEKLQPECVRFQGAPHMDNVGDLQQNIVALTKSLTCKSVGEADVARVLQSHEDNLSNEALIRPEWAPGRLLCSASPQASCPQPSRTLRRACRSSQATAPMRNGKRKFPKQSTMPSAATGSFTARGDAPASCLREDLSACSRHPGGKCSWAESKHTPGFPRERTEQRQKG